MGLCEVLTLIFITLKLVGTIGWSWFWVLSPMLPAILCYLVVVTVIILTKLF